MAPFIDVFEVMSSSTKSTLLVCNSCDNRSLTPLPKVALISAIIAIPPFLQPLL